MKRCDNGEEKESREEEVSNVKNHEEDSVMMGKGEGVR